MIDTLTGSNQDQKRATDIREKLEQRVLAPKSLPSAFNKVLHRAQHHRSGLVGPLTDRTTARRNIKGARELTLGIQTLHSNCDKAAEVR